MKEKVFGEIQKVLGDTLEFEVNVPEIAEHGDYSTNVAFGLAKHEKKSPMQLAEEIKKAIETKSEKGNKLFKKIEVVRPGFINFWLDDSVVLNAFGEILKKPDAWGKSTEGKGKTAVVEYFQLNVAKVPHVGHLRSAFIGDALKRMFLALGYKAVSDTHVGDWGTQFGILLYGYKALDEAARKKIQESPFEMLDKLYVETNRRIEEQPELRERAKEEFARLEAGDKENRKLWEWMVLVSMKKLEENAKLLGLMNFDEHRGESAYEKDMPGIVKLALEKRIAEKKEDGAVVVDLTKESLDEAVMLKSDGATTYLLRDLATIQYRKKQWKFWKNLYVVDVRQSHHFRQVLRVAELLGFVGEGSSEHVDVGFMSLPEGPMSSRKGNIIPLTELVSDVVQRAHAIIKEKNPGLKNMDAVARVVGIGALKYFDLSHHRKTDIVFHREQALSFEGNTGPYIQYTNARFKSILRKTKINAGTVSVVFGDNEERLLATTLLSFPDVIRGAISELSPNMLVNYLFGLAQKANNFYHTHPVTQEKDEKKKQMRIALVAAISITLTNGLNLLGIEAPEEM